MQLNKEGHEDLTFVKWLKPGYDELHMRYYVRYGRDYGYHGHGGGGFMADAGKGGFKGAGKAPDGDRFFWATLEPIGPREWDPPVSASTRQGEATASLRFRIGRDGSVAQSTVSVGEPSGDYLFDQSMVRALQAAGNLPPLPPEYPEETLGLEIIFLYQP